MDHSDHRRLSHSLRLLQDLLHGLQMIRYRETKGRLSQEKMGSKLGHDW